MIHRLKIRHKLFLTLLVSSLIVAIGLFLFLQWNFDRGFLKYVNQQEKEQLDMLASRLAQQYKQYGDWAFMVENHGLWQQLHREIFFREAALGPMDEFFTPPLPPRAQIAKSNSMTPPQKGPMEPPMRDVPRGFGPRIPEGMAERVILYDENNEWIIGGPLEGIDAVEQYPITLKKVTIGYLGLIPVDEVSSAGDLLFVEQQTFSFAIVSGVMICILFIISFVVTGQLLRPINELIGGTRKLISGWFSTRIPVTSNDELGILSSHFNNLAATLEENEKVRQLWVADISHELRTPLAVLQGEVEAMQDGIEEPNPENLSAVHAEILHLSRLVGDLYELSMTDSGALNYKKVSVNPLGLLDEVCRLFTPRFRQKDLILSVHKKDALSCTLLADPDRLQQLFTNILENSLKYTAAPGELEVHTTVTSDTLQLEFLDTPPGVPEEQQVRLFERLYRVEKSRNRKTGGAGLGMAICKNIVEAHQGTIAALSSPLGGLQVTVTFPLHNH